MKKIAAFLIITVSVFAQIPLIYQGKLTNSSGVGVSDALDMTFGIYDTESGGTAIWTEAHTGVSIEKGLFTVSLGSVTPLELGFDVQYYVEITIDGDVMSPRMPLHAAAYSRRAAIADSIAGGRNTLDMAYDQGGPGMGRTINATDFPVDIRTEYTGPEDGIALEVRTYDDEDAALYARNAGAGPAIYSSGNVQMTSTSYLTTTGDVNIRLDWNNNTDDDFIIENGAAEEILTMDEAGNMWLYGSLSVPHIQNNDGDSIYFATSPWFADSFYFDGEWRKEWPEGGSGGGLWEYSISDGADTSIVTMGKWGIARAGATMLGAHDSTHVNLGVGSFTGDAEDDMKYATVGGGFQNTASAQGAVVSGGSQNMASATYAHVGGGWINMASGPLSTVSGGQGNRAAGNAAAVLGGITNNAAGSGSAILGGSLGRIYGQNSAIVGGYADTVWGDFSMAFGQRAVAHEDSTVVFDWYGSQRGGLFVEYSPTSDSLRDRYSIVTGQGAKFMGDVAVALTNDAAPDSVVTVVDGVLHKAPMTAGGGGNSLEEAYNEGGPGSGAQINALAGPVDIRTAYTGPSDGNALQVRTNDNISGALYALNAGDGPAIYSSGDIQLTTSSEITSTGDIDVHLDININTEDAFNVKRGEGDVVFFASEEGIAWADSGFDGSTIMNSEGDSIYFATSPVFPDSFYFDAAWRKEWPTGSGGSGTVTSVSAVAPLDVTDDSTTSPTLTIAQATTASNGFLTSVDWNRFDAATENVFVVTTENYETIEPVDRSIINMRDIITLPGGSCFDEWRYEDYVFMSGGGFTATANDTFEMGDNWVITGADFDGVVFDGNYTTFINCSFKGGIGRFPWGANFIDCDFYNISQNTNYSIGTMDGCEIEYSTILRASRITNSYVNNCTIAGTALNFELVNMMDNNRFNDCLVHIRRGTVFTDNNCDETLLSIPYEAYGLIQISNNIFDNIKAGETECIQVNCMDSGYKNWLITDNIFIIQSGDPQSIRVFNNDGGGSYSILKISGNSFLKGSQALNISSNIRCLVSDNVYRQTTLGTLGSYTTSSDNFGL